jgi:UDP-glucose 4-epimerase
MTRILVTGAGGFIAGHLVPYLARAGHDVIAVSHAMPIFPEPRISVRRYPESPGEWAGVLEGVEAVVHLVGIAHRSAGSYEHELVTRDLAAEAAAASSRAGVKHFIFVSSIAAQTGASADHIITESDVPLPAGPYGVAKLAAEEAVRRSGVPFTVLRPVVVEGPDAKGTFGLLNRIAGWPLPLPLASLGSRRSTLSIANFNAAVTAVLLNPRALGETFVAADPEPRTVAEIVAQIRARSGRAPNLFAMPPSWLRAACDLFGRQDVWERLDRPLVVSPAKLLAIGWKPTKQ